MMLDPNGKANVDKLNRIIPTFGTPWVHRDKWNDKDWYYPVEGVWHKTGSYNMEKVYKLIGAGTFTSEMVLRSRMVISLQEDFDFGWWVRSEYLFKGKGHLGFKKSFHKMTSNKYYPGIDKGELLEDWDKRWLDTTASLIRDDSEDLDDKRITFHLDQIAFKDMVFNYDSEVLFEASDDNESLTMTTTIKTPEGDVSGILEFSRYDLDLLNERGGSTSRRTSFCLGSRRSSIVPAKNRSRRGSVNLLPGGVDPNDLLSIIKKKSEANASDPINPGEPNNGPTPEIEISHHL